jgi:hypothetical protein
MKKPNQRIDLYFKWPGTAIRKRSFSSFDREMTKMEHSRINYQALRRLRARHSMMLRLLVASLVLVFGGLLLSLTIPPPLGDWIVWLPQIGMILVVILVILSFPFGRTPCPRCGKPYYVPAGFWGFLFKVNLSYRQCVHCALPLNTKENETVEQAESTVPSKAAPSASSDDR